MHDDTMRRRLLLDIPSGFLLLFFVMPLVALVVLSFWQTENYKIVREWTLMNYGTLATEGAYITFFIRSLLMAIGVGVVLVVISWPIAYFIVRYGGRYRIIFSLLLVIPFLSGEVLRLIALQGMLGPAGLLNGALLRMGAAPLRMIMYSNFASFIAFLYLYLPLVVTTIYLSLINFDFRLAHAASACGANRFSVFREVVWPLNLSGTIVGFMLAFIPTLSASLVPRFLGGPNGTLYGMSMAQQFGESGTWALGAAMGVVLFLFSAAALVILSFGVDLRRTGFTGLGRQ
ncbi:ABC transporter permease [Rhizobium sp. S95]|uniref:ABC transporter permease n=1 Tax=Ciceribacter sichuanensis TaxID=2949647 RepID=A0AAJ1F927_9HYPH|nr:MULTISPECIES: ABC transporter permease [unclassified Ciceribacter]MCM2395979.1 ABC transporter permease [Ciceribacter sp. S95]MCO5959647.1 ABC transporter permease [Ciceribacter sp. S101]